MKYKENILRGLSAQVIAETAGVSKASVYNWASGGGRLVGPHIELAIESLLKQQENGNHGREQEPEFEGSISNPVERSLA